MGVKDPVPHDSYKCVPMAENKVYNNYVRWKNIVDKIV